MDILTNDSNELAEDSEDLSVQLANLLDEHDYDFPEVGDIRTGIIVSMSSQGVIVDLGLKRDGLVQPSDLDELTPEDREELKLEGEVPVYIVDTSQSDRLLVSIHRARMNQDWIRAEELIESGDIVEAPVIGYNRGGIIVPFGNLRGFVPASHLTDLRRGMDDRQRQQVMAKLRNEVLPLKVIEVNRRRRRLVLSQRDAQKEWQETRKEALIDKLQEGDTVKGRVSGLRNFGAFVDLGGADGLIHISELAWHRVNHPREVIKVGDEVEVYILSLDKDDQRIALSRKRLLQNPWDTAEERYQNNQLVEGMVTRIVNYGAFVEIEPGVEGLLHISQLSRDNVEDPNEVIKEGETHLLRVVSVDSNRQRIGLSLKSVTANEQIAWMTEREAAAAETAASEPAVDEEEMEEIDEEMDAPIDDDEIEIPDAEAELETSDEIEEDVEETEAEVAPEPVAEVEETEAEVEPEPVAEVEETEAEVEPEPMAAIEETADADDAEPEDAGSTSDNEDEQPVAEPESDEETAESDEETADTDEESDPE
jgi:small subunit ribosomal protein S1